MKKIHPSMKTAAKASLYEMKPDPWKPTTEYVNCFPASVNPIPLERVEMWQNQCEHS